MQLMKYDKASRARSDFISALEQSSRNTRIPSTTLFSYPLLLRSRPSCPPIRFISPLPAQTTTTVARSYPTMRLTLTLPLALAGTVLAAPALYPQDITVLPTLLLPITIPEPTSASVPSTSLNIPITSLPMMPTGGLGSTSSSSTRKKPIHTEPVPIFSRSCDCPKLATMQYPCWATDALQVCSSFSPLPFTLFLGLGIVKKDRIERGWTREGKGNGMHWEG